MRRRNPISRLGLPLCLVILALTGRSHAESESVLDDPALLPPERTADDAMPVVRGDFDIAVGARALLEYRDDRDEEEWGISGEGEFAVRFRARPSDQVSVWGEVTTWRGYYYSDIAQWGLDALCYDDRIRFTFGRLRPRFGQSNVASEFELDWAARALHMTRLFDGLTQVGLSLETSPPDPLGGVHAAVQVIEADTRMFPNNPERAPAILLDVRCHSTDLLATAARAGASAIVSWHDCDFEPYYMASWALGLDASIEHHTVTGRSFKLQLEYATADNTLLIALEDEDFSVTPWGASLRWAIGFTPWFEMAFRCDYFHRDAGPHYASSEFTHRYWATSELWEHDWLLGVGFVGRFQDGAELHLEYTREGLGTLETPLDKLTAWYVARHNWWRRR